MRAIAKANFSDEEKQLIRSLFYSLQRGTGTTNTYMIYDYLGFPQELDEESKNHAQNIIDDFIELGILKIKASGFYGDLIAYDIDPVVNEHVRTIKEGEKAEEFQEPVDTDHWWKSKPVFVHIRRVFLMIVAITAFLVLLKKLFSAE